MIRTLGKATIRCNVNAHGFDSEYPGECHWTIEAGQLRKILEAFPSLETNGFIAEGIGNAVEGNGAEFPEMDADMTVSFGDADSGIMLLCAMAEIGGEWSIAWEGDNATWFFHDWDHAMHDCDVDAGKIEISVDGQREERAQVNGAREALRNGVDIDDVCSAVISILDEFESRFQFRPTNLLARVFAGFKVTEAYA